MKDHDKKLGINPIKIRKPASTLSSTYSALLGSKCHETLDSEDKVSTDANYITERKVSSTLSGLSESVASSTKEIDKEKK